MKKKEEEQEEQEQETRSSQTDGMSDAFVMKQSIIFFLSENVRRHTRIKINSQVRCARSQITEVVLPNDSNECVPSQCQSSCLSVIVFPIKAVDVYITARYRFPRLIHWPEIARKESCHHGMKTKQC